VAYDPNGEWGLRRRVRVAYELTQSYSATAAQLGVTTAVVTSFLTDPAYIPSAPDQATMVSNLANIIPVDAWTHERKTPTGHIVTYVECPLFTPEIIEALEPPPGAVSFLFTYFGDNNSDPSGGGTLKNTHSHGYPGDDPAEVAAVLFPDQYDLIVALVWFSNAP
jgi:hypothetical protein